MMYLKKLCFAFILLLSINVLAQKADTLLYKLLNGRVGANEFGFDGFIVLVYHVFKFINDLELSQEAAGDKYVSR